MVTTEAANAGPFHRSIWHAPQPLYAALGTFLVMEHSLGSRSASFHFVLVAQSRCGGRLSKRTWPAKYPEKSWYERCMPFQIGEVGNKHTL